MNKKYAVSIALLSLLFMSGCGEQNLNSLIHAEPTKEKLVSLLENIQKDRIVSYDFTDRSYSYNSYANTKYGVSGNIKVGLVNYEARHHFELYQNEFTQDEISIDALDGVETTKVVGTTEAKGQIFTEDGYIYDYFVCESLPSQSFVNCYEEDVYQTFDTYFNYLSILDNARYAFKSPDTYFPEDSGYENTKLDIQQEGNLEYYQLGSQYPGDSAYKPYIIDFDITYNRSTNTFEKIVYQERSLFDTLDCDFEIGTSTLFTYTISNLTFGKKEKSKDSRYTFDTIEDKSKIHDAPESVIDVSSYEDGSLSDEVSLDIIRNIYAYSKDIRQTNYSMIYHDAFDFADTDRATFGDAMFSGKMIAYQDHILDNHGTIQLVDENDQPKGEASAYRIFTKATDEGIFRGGMFDRYITSAFAYVSKNRVTSSRAYLDANPLYWIEIAEILDIFSSLNLGKNALNSGATMDISVSGVKTGNRLEIKGSQHYKTNNGYNIENLDTFTFQIVDNQLMYCKLNTTGQTMSGGKYSDVYEARFVHASKTKFTGEEMNILDDISTQITMEDFEII